MSATEAMTAALLALTDAGSRPPCGDRTGRWTSEDPKLRIWAARRCPPCQLAKVCHDLAAEIEPSFGVWAGHDWQRRPNARRTT